MRIKNEGKRKGMTMAIGIIIAIVVLIVVALAVIAITSGALGNFGVNTGETSGRAGGNIKGTASCASCGFTWTKGDTSTLNDVVFSLPAFCQTSGAVDYCCTDITHQKCKLQSACGLGDTTATNPTWATCTPAV